MVCHPCTWSLLLASGGRMWKTTNHEPPRVWPLLPRGSANAARTVVLPVMLVRSFEASNIRLRGANIRIRLPPAQLFGTLFAKGGGGGDGECLCDLERNTGGHWGIRPRGVSCFVASQGDHTHWSGSSEPSLWMPQSGHQGESGGQCELGTDGGTSARRLPYRTVTTLPRRGRWTVIVCQ